MAAVCDIHTYCIAILSSKVLITNIYGYLLVRLELRNKFNPYNFILNYNRSLVKSHIFICHFHFRFLLPSAIQTDCYVYRTEIINNHYNHIQ